MPILVIPLAMLVNPRQALAEWSVTTRGALYFTNDVGIFSATRRLARDADMTRAYFGLQYSRRKESFELESIENINVGIGLETTF